MATLDVVPPALVSAAAAVRCFAADMEPVALGDEPLTDVFGARWGSALRGLATDADDTALSLRDAATGYLRVDSLLVPAALR